MQIDIRMTVMSPLQSSDLAADSFFVLVRTYQLQTKTYLILKNFPHTLLKSLIALEHSPSSDLSRIFDRAMDCAIVHVE